VLFGAMQSIVQANASFRHSARAFAAQSAVRIQPKIVLTAEFEMEPTALEAEVIFAQVI